MPAKNPRIMVVLEKPLYKTLSKKAHQDGLSVSAEARDLIREAMEAYEDLFWAKQVDHRIAKLNRKKLISHENFWKKVGL